jgi:hypothetical protein
MNGESSAEVNPVEMKEQSTGTILLIRPFDCPIIEGNETRFVTCVNRNRKGGG